MDAPVRAGDPEWPLSQLRLLLSAAYSGELGAARAYAGHRWALRGRPEWHDVTRILKDELHHRHVLLRMLAELGSAPDPSREAKLNRVGTAISLFSRIGGWFLPMYGAGMLEAQNIREYEHAARLAHLAGQQRFVSPLLELAEVEWDHEVFFRTQAASHPLWRVMPHWKVPPPRESIRQRFAEFEAGSEAQLAPVRLPLLVR